MRRIISFTRSRLAPARDRWRWRVWVALAGSSGAGGYPRGVWEEGGNSSPFLPTGTADGRSPKGGGGCLGSNYRYSEVSSHGRGAGQVRCPPTRLGDLRKLPIRP